MIPMEFYDDSLPKSLYINMEAFGILETKFFPQL